MKDEYISITLPSKCLVYSGVDSISIRPMKGKDEEFIDGISLKNVEKRFVSLLKNVLVGIEPEELTVGDRLYLLIWLTINSYSREVTVRHLCSGCAQEVDVTCDLSKMEVIELPDNFKEPFEVVLSNGDTVGLRLFRVEDDIKISSYEEKNESSYLFRYALSLVDQRDILAKMEFLGELPSKDMIKIRAFQEKFHHGPSMEFPYKCKFCGEEGLIDIPFRIEYLFPTGKELGGKFEDLVLASIPPNIEPKRDTGNGSSNN